MKVQANYRFLGGPIVLLRLCAATFQTLFSRVALQGKPALAGAATGAAGAAGAGAAGGATSACHPLDSELIGCPPNTVHSMPLWLTGVAMGGAVATYLVGSGGLQMWSVRQEIQGQLPRVAAALHGAQVRQLSLHGLDAAQDRQREGSVGQPVASAAQRTTPTCMASFLDVCALKTSGGSLGLAKMA